MLACAEAQDPPEYNLEDPKSLAEFLTSANIRLVRGAFIQELARQPRGQLPRRQEAERASCQGSHTALVTFLHHWIGWEKGQSGLKSKVSPITVSIRSW